MAGLILGMAENLCLAFIDPQWSEAVTFVILFLFILFRPGGVYGRAVMS
jgi:branched-chain amino acid transport system permease protein